MAKPKAAANGKAKRGGARRSKAENFTGAKENAVEKRTVGIGDNSGALPLPARADILEAINDIKGWNAKAETINAKRKLAYKAWKAKHVSSETIKELIALERGDANEYRNHIESYAIGLAAVGAPFQISVFDTAYGSDVEQAKAEATIAAKNGRAPECRYAENSEAHEAYMQRYSEIQAARVPGAENLTDEERAAAVTAGRSASSGQEAAVH